MKPQIQIDIVLTEPEARQLLRLSKITLLRMRQLPDQGGLPFVQLSPGRIGYFHRDVLAYLTARRVGALPGEMAEPPQQHRAIPRTSGPRRRAGIQPPDADQVSPARR